MLEEEKKEEEQTDAERIADTNVEGIGSEEHRDAREDAAKTEKAWKGAGTKEGLEVWRIEKFKVKRWPKDRYGEFYSGDSYIVLNSKELKDKDGNVAKMQYDVFFWLGKESTQDERGTAAYKTVELDDLLGDEPTQYREVQGNESRMFLDCFSKLAILDGGIASGFNKIKPTEYKPRLMHVTGYRDNVLINQVPMESKQLNNVDAFILDAGTMIYMYYGPNCNAWEKRKAQQNVNELKDSRFGKVDRVVVVDGLTDTQKEAAGFWEFFGGKPSEITDGDETPHKDITMNMFKVSDASGKVEFTNVADGFLDLEKLDSGDVFICDTMMSVYIWIGKDASRDEKRKAMPEAVAYLENQGRDPMSIPICRVLEGKEPAHFMKVMKSGKKKWDADMMKDVGFTGRRSSVTVLKDLQE